MTCHHHSQWFNDQSHPNHDLVELLTEYATTGSVYGMVQVSSNETKFSNIDWEEKFRHIDKITHADFRLVGRKKLYRAIRRSPDSYQHTDTFASSWTTSFKVAKNFHDVGFVVAREFPAEQIMINVARFFRLTALRERATRYDDMWCALQFIRKEGEVLVKNVPGMEPFSKDDILFVHPSLV